MSASVYVLRDEAGDPLYIGCSSNVKARCRAHRTRDWWPEVASTEEIPYETRDDALMAEARLIHELRPKHNAHHNRPRSNGISTAAYLRREDAKWVGFTEDERYEIQMDHLRSVLDSLPLGIARRSA